MTRPSRAAVNRGEMELPDDMPYGKPAKWLNTCRTGHRILSTVAKDLFSG